MIETSQLSGLEGNFQAEPRVFAHDAKPIVIGAINNSEADSGLNVTNFGTGYIVGELITVTTPTGTGGAVGDRAVVKVLTINGAGVVLTYEMSTVGAKYLVGDAASQESTTGTGTDFAATVSNINIPNTQQRGCCLYIGAAGNISVIMEGGTEAITFSSLAAGTFLPILVTRITAGTSLIALY